MSGGSYDYLYLKIDDAACRLVNSDIAERRAFGMLLQKVRDAMKDIEWVDSCDSGPGDELKAIREALGPEYKTAVFAAIKADAEEAVERLTAALERMKTT